MRRNLLISTRVTLEQYWFTQHSLCYSVTSTVYILMPIYLEDISQYGVGGWIGEEEGQTTAQMRMQERQGQISNNARYTVCPFESLHFIVSILTIGTANTNV